MRVFSFSKLFLNRKLSVEFFRKQSKNAKEVPFIIPRMSLNILVVCPEKQFPIFKDTLIHCLRPNRYVVYHLPLNQLDSYSWRSNTELVIVSDNHQTTPYINVLRNVLFQDSRKLLITSFNLAAKILDEQFIPKKESGLVTFSYRAKEYKVTGNFIGSESKVRQLRSLAEDENKAVSLVARTCNQKIQGSMVVIQEALFMNCEFEVEVESDKKRLDLIGDILGNELDLDCSLTSLDIQTDSQILNYCHLVTKKEIDKVNILESLQDASSSGKFQLIADQTETESTNKNNCFNQHSIKIDPAPDRLTKDGVLLFDATKYFDNLESNSLGKVLLFSEVVTTTMDLIQGPFLKHGCVAVARQQTCGKGRGSNQWLSPMGCAMWTTCLEVNMATPLGRKPTFLQHLAAMAMILGVRNIPACKDLNLRIKWPNDVYWNRDTKLGGLIVQSQMGGKDGKIHFVVGCGINVLNDMPTTNLQSLIDDDSGTVISCEEVIARSLTQLELLVDRFQDGDFVELIDLYYSLWLHSDSEVYLADTSETVKIKGLDDFGFLLVQPKLDTVGSRSFSLQPDGNSFDIMANLIRVKK